MADEFSSQIIDSMQSAVETVSLSDLDLPDRYELIEILGGGGMGFVVKARDRQMGDLVAIKLITEILQNNTDQLQRFQREAKTLAKLKHPHIVQIKSFGVTPSGRPYQVMEYLEGQTLAGRMERGELRLAEFKAMILQLIEGLKYAGSLGVVHRDIKPSNICLCKGPEGELIAKLLDFGIARQMQAEQGATITATNAAVGSPLYMSPEQCRGMAVDQRSDIYALGCVMYHCITGKPPHLGDSPLETLYLHSTAEVAKIQSNDKTTKQLAEVIYHCLEKEPSKRPQSFEDLNNAITVALTDIHESFNLSLSSPVVASKNPVKLVAGITLIAVALLVLWTPRLIQHFELGEKSDIEVEVGRLRRDFDGARKGKDVDPGGREGETFLNSGVKLVDRYNKLGKTAQAESILREVLDTIIRRKDVWAEGAKRIQLGRMLLQSHDPSRYPEAEEHFKKATAVFETWAPSGENEERCIRYLGDMVRARFNTALVHMAMGRYRDARADQASCMALCDEIDKYRLVGLNLVRHAKSNFAFHDTEDLKEWGKPTTPEQMLDLAAMFIFEATYMLSHDAGDSRVNEALAQAEHWLNKTRGQDLTEWSKLDSEAKRLRADWKTMYKK